MTTIRQTSTTILTSAPRPLIISDEIPGPVSDVCEVLRDRGVEPLVFRPSQDMGSRIRISTRYSSAGLNGALTDLESGYTRIIDSSTRIWTRKPEYPNAGRALDPDPEVSRFIRNQYRVSLDSLFTLDAVWMNPLPLERKLDQNKLLQAGLAAGVGLKVPATLCSDSPDECRQFIEALPAGTDVALKATAAWMSEVSGEDVALGTYTRRLGRQQALELISLAAHAPVILQPYIEKSYELRVTIVDREVFACRIDSQASDSTKVDWRHYNLDNTPHSAVELEPSLNNALVLFMETSGLTFAAVDLIVDAAGDVIFLEANPCGAYGWIEAITDLPITQAIANWLLCE